MRFITKEEYEKERESFLALYAEEIKNRIIDEKKIHFAEIENRKKFIPGAKDYFAKFAKSHFLVLLVGFFGITTDSFKFQEVLIFLLIQLFVFTASYGMWIEDIEKVKSLEFLEKGPAIVSYFIYKKKLEALSVNMTVEEFLKKEEFFSIAEHEIPYDSTFSHIYR